jgi:formylglycine-generating enzyme required for sulfatase activity
MARFCCWVVTILLLASALPALGQERDSARPRTPATPPPAGAPLQGPPQAPPASEGQDRTIGVLEKPAGDRQPVAGGASVPAMPAVYGDSWAVIVGINDYNHAKVPKLGYAVNDARAVERALLRQGFKRDNVFTLLDGKATKAEIERVLADDLRARVGPQDRVLMFFAGHGKTDNIRSGEEEGYLIPADGDPARLFSTAISMSSLRNISDRLAAKHILFVVDACYSGYAVFNRAISDDLLEEMIRKPAIQILTAGRQNDQAQERAGHGVFTDVLLRGLEGEAYANKHWLSLEELGVWMKQRVFAESNRRQLPQFGNLSGEGQFVFTRPGAQVAMNSPAPPPARPAPRVEAQSPRVQEEAKPGSLAISSKVDGVEVYVDGQKIGDLRLGRVLVARDVAPGVYKIRGRKAGHRDWEREVQVESDRRVEVGIDIEPLRNEPTRTEPAPAVRGEDGVTMLLVPAGEFTMGTADGDEREQPRHRLTVASFYIDIHEVTNAQFRGFVEGRGYERMELWTALGWKWRKKEPTRESPRDVRQPAYWHDIKWNEAQQPVVGVSWFEADAYCKFVGKRLPTEAEWEKAARGTEDRRYPWGDAWEPRRANTDQSKLERTRPVGSYPTGASAHGVLDLAGNAAEWVADWYHREYYKRSPEKNPKGPDTGEEKVIRGGSWDSRERDVRTTSRRGETPDERNRKIGFRCAIDPPAP